MSYSEQSFKKWAWFRQVSLVMVKVVQCFVHVFISDLIFFRENYRHSIKFRKPISLLSILCIIFCHLLTTAICISLIMDNYQSTKFKKKYCNTKKILPISSIFHIIKFGFPQSIMRASLELSWCFIESYSEIIFT